MKNNLNLKSDGKVKKHNKAEKAEKEYVICANPNCGKKIEDTEYSQLCRGIMKHKPVCSYACNKAIGQVK